MPRPKLEDKIMQLGGEVYDWENIRAQMDENPMSNSPRKKVAKKQNLQENALYNTNAPFVYEIIGREKDHSTSELVNYVKSNVNTVLNKYNDKNLFVYMTGSMRPVENKDKDHNDLAYVHGKFLEVQQYKKDPSAMSNFIADEKGKDKPYLKDVFHDIAEADPFFREIAFKSREIFYTDEFTKSFSKKDGKLDKDKINKYVKDTYAASPDEGKNLIAYGLGMKLYEQFANAKK